MLVVRPKKNKTKVLIFLSDFNTSSSNSLFMLDERILNHLRKNLSFYRGGRGPGICTEK